VTQAEQTLATARGAVEKWTEKVGGCRDAVERAAWSRVERNGKRSDADLLREQLAGLPALRETAATAPTHRARLEELNRLEQAVKDAKAGLETAQGNSRAAWAEAEGELQRLAEQAASERTKHSHATMLLREQITTATADEALLDEVPCATYPADPDILRPIHDSCPLLASARERVGTLAELRRQMADLMEQHPWDAILEQVAEGDRNLEGPDPLNFHLNELDQAVKDAQASYGEAEVVERAGTAQVLKDAEAADAQVRALASAETELARLDAELAALDERIAEHQKVADGLGEASENLREAKAVAAWASQARQEARSAADEAETLLRAAVQATATARAAVGASVQAAGRVDEATKTAEAAGERERIHAMLARGYGRTGVPALLVERAVPMLEDQANRCLQTLTEGELQVRIATTRETQKGDTIEALVFQVAKQTGETLTYAQCSGGEREDVDNALRIALVQLAATQSGTQPEALILDEPCAALDDRRLEGFAALLEELKAQYGCVVVCTHLQQLKERGDRVVLVIGSEDGSTVMEAA